MARPVKKRRIQPTEPSAASQNTDPIATSRELLEVLTDYTGAGIRRVRDLLNRCSPGNEIDETEVTRNRAILREYLEVQSKRAPKTTSQEEEEEDESAEATGPFADVAQMWKYAMQNNSQNVMTLIPATLAILVRVCSHNEDLRPYGNILIKSILQQSNLKIVYRCLTGTKEHHKSPCLRLLAEMNRFDFGAMCGAVYAAFDFTIKDLVKNFDAGKKGEVEEPHRPSIRTLMVRFFLSFLQNGEPSVRTEVLGLRTWVNALFKHIKQDTPPVVADVLETLLRKAMLDKEVSRQVKTAVFNETVLANVVSLYTRDDDIKIQRAGKEEEKTLAGLAHEFLTSVCTTRGNGVCFQDQGWYPPGYAESDGKKRGTHKVFNRALSSFTYHVRPYADDGQLDLLLDIFRTSPELVADYFTSNSVFSFEPKLTTTWIGYATFIEALIALPVPENLGATKTLTVPPPTDIVIENILPRPLTKIIMTKCLSDKTSFIRFLSTRILIASFKKLQAVLKTLDAISESLHDPQGNWLKFRISLIEEFCKRIPEVSACSAALGASSKQEGGAGLIQTEAYARLLAEYYTTIPEIALQAKLDVNAALIKVLEAEEEKSEEEADKGKKAMRLLEMGHLLRVAGEMPDTKWWNKTPQMKHSPFVSVLKHCSSSTSTPSSQVRTLLHNFAATSQLFQTDTVVSPLDALLESLTAVSFDPAAFTNILSFLDECVGRCVRQPFKYLDEFTELAMAQCDSLTGQQSVGSVSPLLMTLAEQWKFFAASKDAVEKAKVSAAGWLCVLFDGCALAGENVGVLAVLEQRMAEVSEGKDVKEVFEIAARALGGKGTKVVLVPGAAAEKAIVGFGGRIQEKRKVILDTTVFEKELEEGKKKRAAEATLLKLAIALRGVLDVMKCQEGDVKAALETVKGLATTLALKLTAQGEEEAEKTKTLAASQVKAFRKGLEAAKKEGITGSDRCAAFSVIADILTACFEEDDTKFVEKVAGDDVVKMILATVDGLEGVQPEEISKFSTSVRAVCLLGGLNAEGFTKLVSHLSGNSDKDFISDIIVFLLGQSVKRSEPLELAALEILLGKAELVPKLAKSIANYIKNADASSLEGLKYKIGTHEISHAPVECALIRKLPAFRASALDLYYKHAKKNTLTSGMSAYFEALLEAYCITNDSADGFELDPSAPEDVQEKLSKILTTIWPQLLENPLDAAQIEVFIRAGSIIKVFDKEAVMEHVAKDRKRSNLTDRLVHLLTVVLDSDDEEERDIQLESAEMKGWFLMVFDHVTRRLAEDKILSDKVSEFVDALATFLEKFKPALKGLLPRSAYNAVIEAALEHHINVPSVVSFIATVVSLLPANNIDVTKSLQTILNHKENPLLVRTPYTSSNREQLAIAFLIHRLFTLDINSTANLTTLDSVLLLYRGLNDPTDHLLLDILNRIEHKLTRSLASRVELWQITEVAQNTPLVDRVRSKLAITVDQKLLTRSMWHLPLRHYSAPSDTISLSAFLTSVETDTSDADGLTDTHTVYDPRFLLPVLSHLLLSPTNPHDALAAVERNCAGFAYTSLSSRDPQVRSMATSYLSSLPPNLSTSRHKAASQLRVHLSSTVSAILSDSTLLPLPSIISLYLASTLHHLLQPTHFLHPLITSSLLSTPSPDLTDIPYHLSLIAPDSEHTHQHVLWCLSLLSRGCRTEQDLELYGKRNLLQAVMGVMNSPSLGQRGWDKAGRILWEAAGVRGGAKLLVTRLGALGWVEEMVAEGREEEWVKRLGARLVEAVGAYGDEWSRGGVRARLVGKGSVLRPE